MAVRGIAAVLAAGLVLGPLAVLHCDARDATQEACCRDDMAHCNQPGKAQDCCKKNAASREDPPELARASAVPGPAPLSRAPMALTVTTAHALDGSFALVFAGRPASPPPTASPPLCSVLRI